MKNRLVRLVRNDSGATAIEYGMIAGLIAVVIIVAITTIGTDLLAYFNAIGTGLTAPTTP